MKYFVSVYVLFPHDVVEEYDFCDPRFATVEDVKYWIGNLMDDHVPFKSASTQTLHIMKNNGLRVDAEIVESIPWTRRHEFKGVKRPKTMIEGIECWPEKK